MYFLNEFNLIFLLLTPLIFFLFYYRLYRFSKIKNIFNSIKEHNKLFIKEIIKSIILIFAFLFLIISYANPSLGKKTVEDTRKGEAIYILLDISRSMLAQDVSPSRLDLSTLMLKSLLNQLPQAYFSLYGFKGELIKLVPLTKDLNTMLSTLSYINPDIYTSYGTDIEKSLDTLIKSIIDEQSNKKKTILLVSDGGEEKINSIGYFTQKKEISESIEFIVVGVGDSVLTSVKLENDLLKDKNGNVVFTKLNEDNFSNLIKYYNATYFNLKNDLDIINIIDYFNNKNLNTKTIAMENYSMFLILFLIMIAFFVIIKFFD